MGFVGEISDNGSRKQLVTEGLGASWAGARCLILGASSLLYAGSFLPM